MESRYSRHRAEGILRYWALLCSVSLAGCSLPESAEDLREKQVAQVEEVEELPPMGCVERPGPTAMVVRWNELAESAHVSQLSLLVENTTAEAQTVELQLSGTTPSGQDIIDQKWTELVLGAKESRVLQVQMDNVPVKSTVHPAGLRVVATHVPSADKDISKGVVFTEPVLLTFDADFKGATARTTGEQARVHALAPDLNALLRAKGEVRVRNEKTGAFAERSLVNPATGFEDGPMVVRNVSPAEVAQSESSYHFPDTEVLAGDAGEHFKGEDLRKRIPNEFSVCCG